MSLLLTQQPGLIYLIFQQYGDSIEGRTRATRAITYILKKIYGDAYQFLFYGKYVTDGLITKAYSDRYVYLSEMFTVSVAMATLEAEGALYVSFIKAENPSYIYPWYVEYRILPYNPTDRHLFLPKGIQNLKYSGSKLTGASINSNSTQTIDGGPVVKVTRVNQNQVVFSNNNVTTARANTSGLPVRILTSADTGRLADTTSNARVAG